MIENIEILLSYNTLNVKEIFRLLSENNSYPLLEFIKHIDRNLQTGKSDYILNEENITNVWKNKYLNIDDKENIISFFSVLGKSDLNGQMVNCKTYKEIFNKKSEILEKKETVQCKSTGTIIIGACLLFIILII